MAGYTSGFTVNADDVASPYPAVDTSMFWSAEWLMNINAAPAEILATLPGIGIALARRIIDGRPYADIEGLMNVSGIGQKTLDGLRHLICAQ